MAGKAPQRLEIEVGFHKPVDQPGGGALGRVRTVGRELNDEQWKLAKLAIKHLVADEDTRRRGVRR